MGKFDKGLRDHPEPVYLITGGAGFIGVHLCRRLLASGCQVRVLDNFSSRSLEQLPEQAQCERGDVRDASLVERAFVGIDGCFHLAAVTPESARNRTDQAEVNRKGSAVVLAAARSANVPIVLASSAAVYGDAIDLPLCEEAPSRPLSTYGADKHFGESLARNLAQDGLRCTILRFFNVYGPGQRSGLIANALNARGASLELFGDGEQTRDFVYVDDAVAIAHAAINQATAQCDVINVCTGRATSVLRVIQMLNDRVHQLIGVNHSQARPSDLRHSQGDPTRCLALLGLTCSIGLEEGIERLLTDRALASLSE